LIPRRRTRKSKASMANYPVIQKERYTAKKSDLVKAILGPEIGMVDKITNLVNSGIDIDQTEALFSAICNDKKAEIIMKLLELGANVNHKNRAGDTPLHLAAGTDKLKICEILVNAGAQKEATNKSGDTPFHTAVKQIDSRSKVLKMFDIYLSQQRKFQDARSMMNALNLLIQDPSKLVGGILTPRMFYRLKVTAAVAADMCYDSIEMEDFQNRVPKDRDTVLHGIELLWYVPKREIPEQVYKSYAMGWQQQLEAIGSVMSRGSLPVQALVDQELDCMDRRYNKHYREKGGSLLHGLIAVVEHARHWSRSNGTGEFEECFEEDLEEISEMKILDDNYLFVERFFIPYCVGLV